MSTYLILFDKKTDQADQTKRHHSLGRSSRVLGFSRSLYYRRKQGHRPEQIDQHTAAVLQGVQEKYLSWGFRLYFEYARKKGLLQVGKTHAYRC